ncbi:hypothetical protein SAMN00790413_03824 [Deinococcus hopiensis KR-140]|uniref:Uncharacterized protein n=1 Tax=Deinococcus hopiensis KR-140 TaxID=695939 RepID=A0A1W1UZF1_9DEIO|nr:hypothetical protein SAMN00790413_03824 [Deinococcus hopiensis KR-140]
MSDTNPPATPPTPPTAPDGKISMWSGLLGRIRRLLGLQ